MNFAKHVFENATIFFSSSSFKLKICPTVTSIDQDDDQIMDNQLQNDRSLQNCQIFINLKNNSNYKYENCKNCHDNNMKHELNLNDELVQSFYHHKYLSLPDWKHIHSIQLPTITKISNSFLYQYGDLFSRFLNLFLQGYNENNHVNQYNIS